MDLTMRPAEAADFSAFFISCFYRARNEPGLREACEREWNVLLKNRATISLIVEDRERRRGAHIVGCVQLAFVTDAFVRWARSGVSPGVNAQATQALPDDGSWPLLDAEEVDQANRGDGVNVLIARWNSAEPPLERQEGQRVREFMTRAAQPFYRGYRYKEILAQTIGEKARGDARRSGFLPRADYAEYFRQNPPAPPPEAHPFLVGLHRDEALSDEGEGSLASQLFVYAPPRFGFTPEEQGLISCAMSGNGFKNEDAATLLFMSESAVKKRWNRIYEKAERHLPGLLPRRADNERGQEKKRLLLYYLSHHPEELRPFGRPVPAAD